MNMNKYLLTILGDFETLENCKNIALSITPVVDSPNLKFQYDKGVLIFHFSSEIPKEEIFEYIRGILYGITDSFILTSMSDDVSVSMPQDRYNHLFDLESSDGDMDMKLDMNRIKNNLDFMEEEDDDIVALLLEEMKDKGFFKKPSLNQILDKVLSSGIESLSSFEKETLETYSK
jgi:hypothetical protein